LWKMAHESSVDLTFTDVENARIISEFINSIFVAFSCDIVFGKI